MKRSALSYLPLMALLAGAPASAMAADATVLVASGAVTRVRIASDGTRSETSVSVNDELAQGDLLRTSADGRAQLRFTDGAIVSLQPGTEFRIDAYRYDAAGQRGFFTLLRGALRTATGAIGKRDRDDYRLQTPTATIGIRGTVYVAEQTVCDPSCAPGPRAGLRVAVDSGRIAITTSAGALEIGRGQAAQADSPDAAPSLSRARPTLEAPASRSGPRSEGGGAIGRGGALAGTGDGSTGENAATGEAQAWSGWFGGTLRTGTNPATSPGTGSPPDVPALATRLADLRLAIVPDSVARSPGSGDVVSPGSARGADGTLGAAASLTAGTSPGTREDDPLGVALRSTGLVYVGLRGRGALDAASLAGLAARVEVDERFRMTAVGACPGLLCLSRDAARIVDAGSDPYVSWGRWTDGAARLDRNGSPSALAISANQGLHYLLGVPTPTLPTSGQFAFDLTAATRPTLSDGSAAPGTLQASAVAQFGPGSATRVGLAGQVTMGDSRYAFTTPGGLADPSSSTLRMTGASTFGGSLAATRSGAEQLRCQGDCRVDVRGGFFGPQAIRLGIDYSIVDPGAGRTIDGVGVFTRR